MSQALNADIIILRKEVIYMGLINLIDAILEVVLNLYIQLDNIVSTIKNVAFSELTGIPLVIVEVGAVLISILGIGVTVYKKVR